MRKHNCLAIFAPPQSRDRRKNSSVAMFTTRRNNSHGLDFFTAVLYVVQSVGDSGETAKSKSQ